MKGMGRIFKKRFRRPNGEWYESKIWSIAYMFRGREVKESSGSDRESDARKLLKQRVGEASTGKLIGPVEAKVTFEQLAEDLIRDYQINGKRSVSSAKLSVAHLRRFFGFDKALNITTDRINRYVAQRQYEITELHKARAARKTKRAIELREKAKSVRSIDEKHRLLGEANWLTEEAKDLQTISNASINRELAALKRMFSLGIRGGKLSSKPYIPTLEEKNARQGFFEHPDFLAAREKLPEYLKDAVIFLYRSGWRVSEMRTLEWRDVDLHGRVVKLRPEHSKNKDGRQLPLSRELAELIQQAFRNRKLGCPFVFHRDGHAIGNFKKAWRTACIAAGLSRKFVHDFRRTTVRNLSRAGVPDTVSMSLTGHKTRSVYDRYNISSEKDRAQAVDQLESYLRNQPERSTVSPMRMAVNEISDTIRTQGPSVDKSVASKSSKRLEPPAGVEPATY